MSTRCQVQVVAGGDAAGHEGEKVTLYHHTDGYPSYMLPLIFEAIQVQLKRDLTEQEKFASVIPVVTNINAWKFGRPGKAASFLCAADPGVFEPEAGHELHGDIEWYYRVHCVNGTSGSRIGGEAPAWKVEIYKVGFDDADKASEEKPGDLMGDTTMSCVALNKEGAEEMAKGLRVLGKRLEKLAYPDSE